MPRSTRWSASAVRSVWTFTTSSRADLPAAKGGERLILSPFCQSQARARRLRAPVALSHP